MPEVRDLERKNLHNQMWTFTAQGETSEIGKIFKGASTFDDGGTLEVIEDFPPGANIPSFPENPQEFAPGLDTELKSLAQGMKTGAAA